MFLTVTTTGTDEWPATDLGYLLHKHPDRAQAFSTAHGTAHVFYPEARPERCTAALLLEVDPVGLVRRGQGRGRGGAPDYALAQYVNDRPYAASSLVAVALSGVFKSAMKGRCDSRPELAARPIPLEIEIPALPAKAGSDGDGPALVRRLFEPLGWQVEAEPIALDPAFPDWGDSRYVRLRLTGRQRLADALSQLYVLLPVLDDAKHYWVAPDEVDKLLQRGAGWLADHPEQALITRRYLSRRWSLARAALRRLELARLAETEDVEVEDLDNAIPDEDAPDPTAPSVPPPADPTAPAPAPASAFGRAVAPDPVEGAAAGASPTVAPTSVSATPPRDPVPDLAPAPAFGRAVAPAPAPAPVEGAAGRAASATARQSAAMAPSAATSLGGVPGAAAVRGPEGAEVGQEARPVPLAVQRRGAIVDALRAAGAGRVLDLGCGEGSLIADLLKDPSFTQVTGVEVSARALITAKRRLHLDRMTERQAARVKLLQGALTYTDDRLKGYDAAVLCEVVEHVDPPRLPALEYAVLGAAQPRTVVVTTPNVEYNVRWEWLPAGQARHADHRFEWTRAEFRDWAEQAAANYGYSVAFAPVGAEDPEVGAPTQMAVFTKQDRDDPQDQQQKEADAR